MFIGVIVEFIMGLTKFGIFIRKFRLDKGLLLRDMAKSLGISSAYLSGMETGNKPIPENLGTKIKELYNLKGADAAELSTSIDLSRQQVTVKTNGNLLDNEIMIAFSRGADTLTDEQKKQILNILNGDVNAKS
jgi:transcriptional regulator with XRE-family HTH domain